MFLFFLLVDARRQVDISVFMVRVALPIPCYGSSVILMFRLARSFFGFPVRHVIGYNGSARCKPSNSTTFGWLLAL
jgi:hypothetical protein